MEKIETISYKGYDIEIYPDYEAGGMYYDDFIKNYDGHLEYFTTVGAWNGYTLFDNEVKHLGERFEFATYFNEVYSILDPIDYELNKKEIDRIIKWTDANVFMVPIYVYEHSGITMNSRGFSCPWDSGQAGYIYTDVKRAKEWTGKKRLTKKAIADIYDRLRKEVKYMAIMAEGSYYGYSSEAGSCWGYDDYDYMVKEAKSEIDWHIKERAEKHAKKVKGYIKNNVPLEYRKPLNV